MMTSLNLLPSFFLFSFFISFASSSSFFFNNTGKCPVQQAFALLQFKESLFNFNDSLYGIEYGCPQYPSAVLSWNNRTDCCNWNGISCNQFGDVTGIDISCAKLQGMIHPNSTLFQLPRLQKLKISYNDFSTSQLPRQIGKFSKTLTHLDIAGCGLVGELPADILVLSRLVYLDVSENPDFHFHPYVLSTLLENSTYLRVISAVGVNISWALPTYFNISNSVRFIELRSTGLQGKLPANILQLPYLKHLDLGWNFIAGPFPKVNTSQDISLEFLDLSSTNMSGEIPNSIGHLKNLKYLALISCSLVGSLPKSLSDLNHLTALHLSANMLDGNLSSFLANYPLLEELDLNKNKFRGGLPSWLFNCPLTVLGLGNNKFDAEIHQGSTPSLMQLTNLTRLDISRNDFKGVWSLDTLLSGLPNLNTLFLSYSGLAIVTNNARGYVNHDFYILALSSCNLTAFPNSLRAMKKLEYLDLSQNNIIGRLPHWAGEIGGDKLLFLNISYNLITGLPRFQWDGLEHFYAQSNLIDGPILPSICNMTNLKYFSLSDNRLGGEIPKCASKFSPSLAMLDLSNNRLSGTIPNEWEACSLLALLLNGNGLEGQVPKLLANCRSLKLVNLGHNQLNDTFPNWLGDLPKLLVLVLGSNNFHGQIENTSIIGFSFPLLQVLDLSHNKFVGRIPKTYFQNFNAMKEMTGRGPKAIYVDVIYMYYSITIIVKGSFLYFPRISVDYKIIDLSGNKFEGEIPEVIGTLRSLISLNLSRNHLSGRIPDTLGGLSEIEALDLSSNALIGEIPKSLEDLGFLAVLNLSHNSLQGRIPTGKQFTTFPENSYRDNPKLCGQPLPKSCEDSSSPRIKHGGGKKHSRPFLVIGIIVLVCMSMIFVGVGYFIENILLMLRRCLRRCLQSCKTCLGFCCM